MAQNHNADYSEKPMTTYGRTQGPSRRYRRLRNPTFLSTEWTDKNPLLQRGEIGAESDTHRIKVGDGTTYWNDLPYTSDVIATWGAINGDINDQTDLIDLVDDKVAAEAGLRSDADDGLQDQITDNKDTMDDHITDTNNPHNVTKAQVGLGNVDNTSDADKPISTATQTALDGKVDKNADITGATKCKITYDNKGLVTAGSDLAESDIPSLHLSKISDVTATASEVNVLDGITATTAELNYTDGVTSNIQTQLDGKQATISDLATIRSNASAGKTASDTIATYGNIVTHNVSEFATATQGALADSALQPGDNVSDLLNDAGYLTQHQTLADLGITATASEINVLDGITASTTELNYVDGVTSAIQTQIDGKQPKSASAYNMGNTSGGWTAMSNAQQDALNSGANTTNIGQIATNTSNIANEIIDRQNADNGLQSQIDAIVSKSDVVDIVGTYAELQAYDTSSLGNNDVVKVISDSTHNNAPSYYRWVITGGVGAWVYIGSESETYTKAETDALLNAKQDNITATDGITLTGTTLTNSGVRAVASGTANGTISVNTNGTSADVAVTGLGSAAYTNSNAYATAAQGTKADTAVQPGDLATVATTGNYNDLLNKPTIPAAQVNSDWDAVSGVAQILNKPTLAAVATSGAYSDLSGTPSLATVATSGSYNDLSNKPTIPAAQVNSDWNANSGVAQILNKPTLATVATSGSYNDLSNKPTIPTVNNPTITITQGGITKGSFSLNQASGDTIALDAGGGVGNIDNITITANADDEIQTVAMIDQNSGIDKIWTGESADYEDIANPSNDTFYAITDDIGDSALDIGQITETLNDKVDKGHEVIDFQEPTALNNYTWYRKYRDGWVEQGGYIAATSTSISSKSVSLPITMANANYQVSKTTHMGASTTNSSEWGWWSDKPSSASANTTTTVYLSVANTSYCIGVYWEVKGMAA